MAAQNPLEAGACYGEMQRIAKNHAFAGEP
jgi:hypothetical protein